MLVSKAKLWAAQTWTQNPSYGCANKSKVLLGPTTYLKKKMNLFMTTLQNTHRPNAIQDMTLHKIGQFSKVFKMYNKALPWYNWSYTAG